MDAVSEPEKDGTGLIHVNMMGCVNDVSCSCSTTDIIYAPHCVEALTGISPPILVINP